MARRTYKYEDLQPVFEQLLQDKESDELEFKTAAGGFPKSFWETYSSFANTYGGAIVFGVKEKDGESYSSELPAKALYYGGQPAEDGNARSCSSQRSIGQHASTRRPYGECDVERLQISQQDSLL